MGTPEFLEMLEEFEEENGPAVYCHDCGNFHTVEEILHSTLNICPISGDELDEGIIEQMNNKGYSLNDNGEWRQRLYRVVRD